MYLKLGGASKSRHKDRSKERSMAEDHKGRETRTMKQNSNNETKRPWYKDEEAKTRRHRRKDKDKETTTKGTKREKRDKESE